MGAIQCDRLLSAHSTRVFALSASGDHLILVSPILPTSLTVLDALHSFVNGLPHKKRRKAKQVPCEASLCPFGSKCVHATGGCECRSSCRSHGSVVCGTDRVSYASLCHLSVKSCLQTRKGKSAIRVAHYGNCEKQNPCDELRCGPGEECVVSQKDGVLSADCVCPKNCPNYGDSVYSSPVCSSEGVDYPSICHMKQHACALKANLTARYFGKCDPCATFTCPQSTSCHLASNRKPECRCSQQCPLNYNPVCATDGKTYSNECVMRVSACKEDVTLAVYKKGKCDEKTNPCSSLQCSHGSHCFISSSETADCRCPEKCPPVMKPVCATNGVTYDNECELKRAACAEKSRISVKHEGTCGKGVCASFAGCRSPQVCIPVDGKPECACPQCGDELREVCGSDGRTYPNECKMRRAACLSDKNLFVKYNGICEGCENMKCEFYSSCISDVRGKAECKCPSDCPHSTKEKPTLVCGTDGVTYSSECHLRRSACQQKKFIVVAFTGKCDACLQVECRYGEECRGGVCVCSYNCPSNPPAAARVCGENGVLYPSECHLQLASCQKGAPIAEMPPAHCHSAVATFEDSCLCNRVGSYGPTCDASGQCKCRPGVGGSKCDHCLPNFWGIHLIANGALSCQPCGCSAFGSSRADCEQTTGRCECRRGAIGDKCNKCTNDHVMTPSGCVPKQEYKTPSRCSELRCHHGATCISTAGGLPDCQCNEACNVDHLGIAANMTVCGSDGVTYDSHCQLEQFACRHQLDLVVVSLGICENESDEVQERSERDGKQRLGSSCTLPSDCAELHAVCLTRPGRRGICECGEESAKVGDKCLKIGKGLLLNKSIHDKEELKVDLADLSVFSNISLKITPTFKNGQILSGTAENGEEYAISLENGRFVVEFGQDSLSTREAVSLNESSTMELKWRGKVTTLKTSEEKVTMRVDLVDSPLKFLKIGGQRPLHGILESLTINGVAVSEDHLKPLHSNQDNADEATSRPVLSPITLSSTAYLQFPEVKRNVRNMAEVEIRLKPASVDGLVFFWGTVKEGKAAGDFIALYLVASQPHFFWNLGSGIAYVKAPPLPSQHWSTVDFGHTLKNGSISVDGKPAAYQESQGKNVHLDVSGEDMYIGGVPNKDILPERLRKLGTSFEGSVAYVAVNEESLDLKKSALKFTDSQK